jgi:large subunit ribosomal protein L22
MKRFRARARGRSASIEKPFSNLTIIVRERGEGEVDLKKESRRARGLSKKTKQTKAAADKAASEA